MQHIQNKNITIIGNKGRMGAFFTRKLQGLGLNVCGVDVPMQDAELAKNCASADLALLCVPAAALDDVLTKLCPHLQDHCILADITSVKVQALQSMQKHWQGPIVGTHPLFGSTPPRGGDFAVAIVPTASAQSEHVELVENIFISLGCRTFQSTAEKHDKAMAAIQNLNFITSLAYFAALAGDEDLLPFLTPSFKRRQDAAQKMLTEDSEMFGGLFRANPYSHEYLRKYQDFLTTIEHGDVEILRQRAAWWWE